MERPRERPIDMIRIATDTLRRLLAVTLIVTAGEKTLTAQSVPPASLSDTVPATTMFSHDESEGLVDLGTDQSDRTVPRRISCAVHRSPQFSRHSGAHAVARIDAVHGTTRWMRVGGVRRSRECRWSGPERCVRSCRLY